MKDTKNLLEIIHITKLILKVNANNFALDSRAHIITNTYECMPWINTYKSRRDYISVEDFNSW